MNDSVKFTLRSPYNLANERVFNLVKAHAQAAARAIGEENLRRFYKRTRRAATHTLVGNGSDVKPTSFSLSSAQQVQVYLAFGIQTGSVTVIRNNWDADVENEIASACIALYQVRLRSRISAMEKGVLAELDPRAEEISLYRLSTEALDRPWTVDGVTV